MQQLAFPMLEAIYPEDLYPNGLKPAKPGDAGIDIRAPCDLFIEAGDVMEVDTQVRFSFPNSGLVALALPRSSTGTRGLYVLNTAGVIDSGFQGKFILHLGNRGPYSFSAKRGDRIVQVIFLPFVTPSFTLVEKFSVSTERGEGGLGHTGT